MSALEQSELERLLEIWETSVRATHTFLREEDILFYRPLVRDEYLHHVEITVARDQEGIIQGFIGLVDLSAQKDADARDEPGPPSGSIEMLFVHPESFGKGVGSSLVAFAKEKYPSLVVDVNEQNTGALAFYRRCGFSVVGRSDLDGQGRPFPLLHMSL